MATIVKIKGSIVLPQLLIEKEIIACYDRHHDLFSKIVTEASFVKMLKKYLVCLMELLLRMEFSD